MVVRAFVVAVCVLPLLAQGAAVAQQEFQSALRARPDQQHGEQLFLSCAACHTSTGGGTADGNAPAIAGQHYAVIVKQLVDFRHSRRWDIRMERYSSDHVLKGFQDIADVARYIASLPVQQLPEAEPRAVTDDARRRYDESCASCHGKTAEGSAVLRVPRMAGQNARYLARQMHYALERRRPNFAIEHIVLLARFDDAALAGIADYAASLRGPQPPGN